jgi:8-oxo-dGTP pyrophosphatase MutT (NUDIX family)
MLPKLSAENGREFTCFPTAILVLVVNDEDEVLLFSKKKSEWVVIAGGVEDDETILEAALRELREEAGTNVKVLPIGVSHAHTFHYDDSTRNMISIYYVFRYRGGEVVPGDDMSGAKYEWKSMQDLSESELLIPAGQKWILERSVSFASTFEAQKADLEYIASRSA